MPSPPKPWESAGVAAATTTPSGRGSPMPPPPIPRSRLASNIREPTYEEKGEIVLAKMEPGKRLALHLQLMHEVAKGAYKPRTRKELRGTMADLDWDAFRVLLSDVRVYIISTRLANH